MTDSQLTLQGALANLGASHRRVVAKQVGAESDAPAAIAAVLGDEERLAEIVGGLSEDAQAACTQLAFAAVLVPQAPGGETASRRTVDELERNGLALCFESGWSLAVIAPRDLVPLLRRVRARAHAHRIPDAHAPAVEGALTERLLHDAAALGARIAHRGIQLKADAELFAKARPKLAAALPQLADDEIDLGDERRVEAALTLLQELSALKVVSEVFSGGNVRRELRLDADLPALLDRPFSERVGLTRVLARAYSDLLLLDPLLDELAGRTVALEELGAAVISLFAEARKHLGSGAEMEPVDIGFASAHRRAVCGGAVIGLAKDGSMASATFMPQAPPQPDGHPYVAQGDFELVALRPPLPHERAALMLLCEPVDRREHMARLSRERIHSAVRALGERDPDAILARLRRLAGELPQNVERSLGGWVSQAPPQARLRSAILVDLGDQEAELGDRLADSLGDLLADRLAPGLLAVSGDHLDAVAAVLRRAGVALEPGLQAVSGAWPRSLPAPQQHGESWWRPNPTPGESTAPPPGRLASALEDEQGPSSAMLQQAAEAIDRLQRAGQPPEPAELEGDLLKRLAAYLETIGGGDRAPGAIFEQDATSLLELFEDEPPDAEDTLAEAFEHGAQLELRYAGAKGMVVERVRVADIDDARVLVEDPDTGEQSWRWLKSILDVRPLGD